MFFTFAATDFVGGNGFLAVYLSGVYLGNQEIIHKKSILKAFDGYAWLMQIVMFLTLGLLVYPSQIVPVLLPGLVISLFLIFVARPLSVFIGLSFFKMKNRTRWYISWVGLRGAVPIVFATYPLLAGVEKAGVIFHIVFLITITSVLLQGTTLAKVADWLHVSLPQNVKRKNKIDMLLNEGIKSELREVRLPADSSVAGKSIIELKIPRNTLIAIIEREGKFITPNGATKVAGNDKLLLVSENVEGLAEAHRMLDLDFEEEGLISG